MRAFRSICFASGRVNMTSSFSARFGSNDERAPERLCSETSASRLVSESRFARKGGYAAPGRHATSPRESGSVVGPLHEEFAQQSRQSIIQNRAQDSDQGSRRPSRVFRRRPRPGPGRYVTLWVETHRGRRERRGSARRRPCPASPLGVVMSVRWHGTRTLSDVVPTSITREGD